MSLCIKAPHMLRKIYQDKAMQQFLRQVPKHSLSVRKQYLMMIYVQGNMLTLIELIDTAK